MFRVCNRAGIPLPRFSDDEVINYLVTEALVFKEAVEEKREEQAKERNEWRSDREAMKALAASATPVGGE